MKNDITTKAKGLFKILKNTTYTYTDVELNNLGFFAENLTLDEIDTVINANTFDLILMRDKVSDNFLKMVDFFLKKRIEG